MSRDALRTGRGHRGADRFSIAATGIYVVALLGTTFSTWLRWRVLGKTVLIATDADDAGENDFGAAKDANAFLIEHGAVRLVEHILGSHHR